MAGRRSQSDSDVGGAKALYGLTPAEARLPCALASGESLETYAGAHGIALSTVRWTTKRVLEKTGASRQADLVRLLLAGPLTAIAEGPSEG